MDSVLRDVRFALKLLVRNRVFSLTVLLTLGVCVGTNVAMYSVVRAVVLEPLPFDEPHELVTLYNSYPGAGAERGSNGVPDFFQRRERVQALEEVAAFRGAGVAVGGDEGAERVSALRVTPSFFPMLGVEAALGRTFLEEEMEAGAEPTLLITDGYWREAFAGNPAVIGTTLRANGVPTTVVGVLPPDFRMPNRPDLRMVLPLSFTAEERSLERWHSNNLDMLGRLASGVTVDRVQSQIDALNQNLIEEAPIPNLAQLLEDTRFRTVVVDAQEDLTRDVGPILYLLWGGAAFVLLIGCVNIANLMLARAQGRARELATRLSLGARRSRVSRQIFTEAAVMGMGGAAVGLAIGAVGLRLLGGAGVADLPRGAEIGLDGPVVLYTLGVALAAAIAFGVVPVWHLFRSDLASVFREEGWGGTSTRRSIFFRNGLVAGQIALAFLLLVGAGLMFRSFRAALDVDPGFDPEGVLTGYVALPESRYPDGEGRREFVRALLSEARALPGVSAAGITTQLPFGNNNSSSVIFPVGYVPTPGESILSPRSSVAAPGYFEALGIEVRRGRGFRDTDGPDGQRVLVIDEWLAHRFWPDGGALGQRMVVGEVPGTEGARDEENHFTVVGVVESLKFDDLTEDGESYVGSYYLAHSQRPAGYFSIALRTGSDPETLIDPLRATVADLDIELPLFGVMSMERRLADSLASERATMLILLVFAGVALTLAVVGVYGILAYAVARRTREIGIRMAVGCEPAHVFGLVLREGMALTVVGLGVGGVGVVLLTGVLESMLFSVQPADPGILALTVGILSCAAVAACVVPARRATRIDPREALTAG